MDAAQKINGTNGRGSPLKLMPLGQLVLHVDQSWEMNGPIWTRSVTSMKFAEWNCDLFRLRSLWANGSYQKGKDVAQVTVRALFRIEADESVEKYRWLNRTQVVGKGYLAAERRLRRELAL